MIPTLGRALVMASLVFATFGCVTGFWAGHRRNREAWLWTRTAAWGFAGSMIAANLLMVYALVTHDFSVAYVAEVGSRNTPLYFTIVSLWASLNGSILFWGGVLGLYVAGLVWFVGDKHREYMPWTLHVLLGIAVFFAFLVASIANPFEPVSPVPPDGPGPNPLLQNHWLMAIHPPMLYLGYVGMSVPFAMICAGLLAGRLESGWLTPVRNGMLIPWMFLGFGIVLGGWWSYAVLGWGGAWAWDPVENASFHPWLTGTAFLHSVMVLQRRQVMREWTLMLGMATFLLTLVGTFMTRSGVFNSVHSFTQSDIGPVFLVFIAAVLCYSVVLLATRLSALDDAARASSQKLGQLVPSGQGSALLSREFAILAQNVLFTAFTVTVLLGTLYPLITEALSERRVSVGEPYFDRWALPIGIGLVFLMGVGPALPWGRVPAATAVRRFAPSFGFALAVAAVAVVAGYTKPIALLALVVVGFAFWSNFGEFLTPLRARMASRREPVWTAAGRVFLRTRRRFGGHVAHFGVLMAVFSLALSRGYRIEEDLMLAVGETKPFLDYQVTFAGSRVEHEPHREAHIAAFAVTRGGRDLGMQEPRANFYDTRREPIFAPSVRSGPAGDLYMSIIEAPEDGRHAMVRVIYQPYVMWLWVSAPIIVLGTVISVWPNRGRRAQGVPDRATVGSPSVVGAGSTT